MRFQCFLLRIPPIVIMVLLILYLPVGLDIAVLCSIFLALIYIDVCIRINSSCMQVYSITIVVWSYTYVCTELHVCLYEYQSFSIDSYTYVLFPYFVHDEYEQLFIELQKYLCSFHTLHGFTCMFVRVSIVFTQIHIHICVVSILIAWIYMYVCMNINSLHMELFTYLCCFHTFYMDLHV